MIPLAVTANLEIDPWRDIDPETLITEDNAMVSRIGLLPNGTDQGRAVVGLLIELPDGRQVVAQTSLRNFAVAAAFLLNSPVAQLEDL